MEQVGILNASPQKQCQQEASHIFYIVKLKLK
jgi:hypothetical protein